MARVLVVLAAVQGTSSFLVLAVALGAGESLTRVPQVILACAFTASSLLLGAATLHDSRSVFLLATFATAASDFARSSVTGLPPRWTAPVDIVLRGVLLEAFTPACLWQFALDFPRVRRFTSFDVIARYVTAAAWLVGLSLFGVNLFASHHDLSHGMFAWLLRDDPRNIFWRLLTIALVPAVIAILVRSRRAPASERRKVARFAWAIAGGAAPFLLLGVVRILSPEVDHWFATATSPARIWLERLVVAALATIPILCTAAVIADRPLDVEFILRHTWVRRLARGTLAAVTFVPLALLLSIIYARRDASMAEIFSGLGAWILMAWGIAGGLLLAARPKLLALLDQHAFGQARDHQTHLTGSLERVRLARGTREVVAVLARELRRSLDAETVHVLVPGREGTFAQGSPHTTEQVPGAVLAMLRETTGPLDLSGGGPIRDLLPQEDREWIAAGALALAAPLKHRDGAVAAIVACGQKQNRLPFSQRDRWLVTALTLAAAAAWDEDSSPPSRHTRVDEAAFECPTCGAVADEMPLPCDCCSTAALAALPRHLDGSFLVERRLGAGGMGVVYLARDLALDRLVALKTLPELGRDAVAQLEGEARAMAALNHESLATIYGLRRWRRTPVLIVEYLPGGTLAARLLDGPLSPPAVVMLGCTLTRALAYMHASGVLHCDLKPSNIGFTAADAPKLLDFGLSTIVAGGHFPAVAGTAAYLPPEAFHGAPTGVAFDLWALAIVMLEAVTGQRPFVTPDHVGTIRRVQRLDLSDAFAAVGARAPALCALFERALAREPRDRFRSAADLHAALEPLSAL